MTRKVTAAAAIFAAALLAHASPALAARGTVLRAVDGDTVRVVESGRQRTVDLLGVRAPAEGDCFATRARRALARRLPPGSRVRLVADPRRPGRGRYVFRGRSFVNAAVLRGGAGRALRLAGLRRAAVLRSAARSAERRGAGLFGACEVAPGRGKPVTAPPAGGPALPSAPDDVAGPGAAENADRVRSALVGRQLLDLSSDQATNERNLTRFCAGNRADRTEEFLQAGVGFGVDLDPGGFTNELAGTWAVMGAIRQDDGTIAADLLFLADDSSFAVRTITVTVAPDGAVRRPEADASELQAGGACAPAQPDGALENDTSAARALALQQLAGKRVRAADGTAAEFCSSTRVVHREGGSLVLDGSWTVEWAASDASGLSAALTLRDARTIASRRVQVTLPTSASAQMTDLGAGAPSQPAAITPAAAC